MVVYYEKLTASYPIVLLEDGMDRTTGRAGNNSTLLWAIESNWLEMMYSVRIRS